MSFDNNFEIQIKQWIQLDNQFKEANERIKLIREKRNSIEEQITQYATSNNLCNSTMQLGGCKLKISNTKQTEPLTFKYLDKTLRDIIKNENQVNLIIEHIKQKREFKTITEIKRFNSN